MGPEKFDETVNLLKNKKFSDIFDPNSESYKATVMVEDALWGLMHTRFPHQRTIDPSKKERLKTAMMAGFQAREQITFCFCEANGMWYLLDGYHRFSVQIEKGISFVYNVSIERAENFDEVIAKYNSLNQGSKRTDMDGFKAAEFNVTSQLTFKQLSAMKSAVRVMEAKYMKNSATAGRAVEVNELMEIIMTRISEAHQFFGVISDIQSEARQQIGRKLTNAAVLAVGLDTFKKNSVAAQKFWTAVSHGEALRIGTPERSLQDFLKGESVHYNIKYWARVVAASWNAYRAGEPLRDSDLKKIDPNSEFILSD